MQTNEASIAALNAVLSIIKMSEITFVDLYRGNSSVLDRLLKEDQQMTFDYTDKATLQNHIF